MSILISNPKFTISDSNGVPLAAGKVYTYVVGTTTLATTFSDADLTPNANPILLNERGECVIYSNQALKIKVTDKDDVTVWTMDDIGVQSLGDYYLSNYASFSAAITAIGSTVGILHITSGTWPVSANLTVPANVTLKGDGGVLSIATGVTLTINGPFDVGPSQVFSYVGTGTVDLSGTAIEHVYAEWWYDGSGDWSPAIQKAATSKPGDGSVQVRLLQSSYTCKTQITMPIENGIHIRGSGDFATNISFEPVANQTLFKWGDGTTQVADSSLMDMTITSPLSNTFTKIFVHLVDVRRFQMERLYIDTSTETGSNSIGLYFQGRDLFAYEDGHIICDRPIVVGANPNAAALKIVLDGSRFDTIELATYKTTGKNIEFEDADMTLTNLSFRKVHSVFGQYGVYYAPTVAQSIFPYAWDFQDCRHEQSSGAGSYGLYLVPTAAAYLKSLKITNSLFAGLTGIYLRNMENVLISSCKSATGNTTYLNIDTSCTTVTTIGCVWDAGVLSKGTMRTAFATEVDSRASTYGRGGFAQYVAGTDASLQPLIINDTGHWAWSGQLANGASKNLPIASGASYFKVAMIKATAVKSDNTANSESAIFTLSPSRPVKLVGTAATSASDTAGCLCLVGYAIKNNLGYAADVTIALEYMPTS